MTYSPLFEQLSDTHVSVSWLCVHKVLGPVNTEHSVSI